MKNYIYTLLVIGTITSCVDAPSNGQKSKPDPSGSRDTQNQDPCTTSSSIQCATTHSGLGKSLIYRNQGEQQYSYDQIQEFIAQDKLPNTHIVNTESNIDSQGKFVTQPASDCGNQAKYNGVKARWTACGNSNANNTTPYSTLWSGRDNGVSGEGDWRLVMRDLASNTTLWIDTRTNLIWSNIVIGESWSRASGNVTVETEKSCQKLATVTGDHISWRLPNRNEFLQADINGARFVLEGTVNYFWTNSSEDQGNAWAIQQSSGILKIRSKEESLQVRCIGVILK